MAALRSASRALLQRVRRVASGADRDRILLEGERLIEEAVRAGLPLELVLVTPERVHEARIEAWARAGTPIHAAPVELLQRASRMTTSPGLLALAEPPPPAPWSSLCASRSSLVAVAAGLADPGNLGALARTAEAAGCEALVVVAGGASPWNPKALRGSMGSLLRLPVLGGVPAAVVARELEGRAYRQVTAATRGGTDYARFEWEAPLALWLAAETGEMPEEARRFPSVTIPMRGSVESLNVTAAASLLLFEAARAALPRP